MELNNKRKVEANEREILWLTHPLTFLFVYVVIESYSCSVEMSDKLRIGEAGLIISVLHGQAD